MFAIDDENKERFIKNLHQFKGWNDDSDCWHWVGSFWVRKNPRTRTETRVPRAYLLDQETRRIRPFVAYYFGFVVVQLGGDIQLFSKYELPMKCFLGSESCVSPHHRFPVERERARPGKQKQHHEKVDAAPTGSKPA